MAHLIKFPANSRPRHVRRAYQLHRLAQSGGVLTSCIITARDDSDAKRQAAGLTAGDRTELWASDRLVAVFGAFENPIASVIRLHVERPTTEQ